MTWEWKDNAWCESLGAFRSGTGGAPPRGPDLLVVDKGKVGACLRFLRLEEGSTAEVDGDELTFSLPAAGIPGLLASRKAVWTLDAGDKQGNELRWECPGGGSVQAKLHGPLAVKAVAGEARQINLQSAGSTLALQWSSGDSAFMANFAKTASAAMGAHPKLQPEGGSGAVPIECQWRWWPETLHLVLLGQASSPTVPVDPAPSELAAEVGLALSSAPDDGVSLQIQLGSLIFELKKASHSSPLFQLVDAGVGMTLGALRRRLDSLVVVGSLLVNGEPGPELRVDWSPTKRRLMVAKVQGTRIVANAVTDPLTYGPPIPLFPAATIQPGLNLVRTPLKSCAQVPTELGGGEAPPGWEANQGALLSSTATPVERYGVFLAATTNSRNGSWRAARHLTESTGVICWQGLVDEFTLETVVPPEHDDAQQVKFWFLKFNQGFLLKPESWSAAPFGGIGMSESAGAWSWRDLEPNTEFRVARGKDPDNSSWCWQVDGVHYLLRAALGSSFQQRKGTLYGAGTVLVAPTAGGPVLELVAGAQADAVPRLRGFLSTREAGTITLLDGSRLWLTPVQGLGPWTFDEAGEPPADWPPDVRAVATAVKEGEVVASTGGIAGIKWWRKDGQTYFRRGMGAGESPVLLWELSPE